MLFEGGRLIGRSSPRTWGCVVYATVIFLSPILFIGLSSPLRRTTRSAHVQITCVIDRRAAAPIGGMARLRWHKPDKFSSSSPFTLPFAFIFAFSLLLYEVRGLVVSITSEKGHKSAAAVILPASKPHRPPSSSLDRRSGHPYLSTFVTGRMCLFFSQD